MSTKDRRQVPHSPCIMRPSPNALMARTVILLTTTTTTPANPRLQGDNFCCTRLLIIKIIILYGYKESVTE